MNLFKNKLKLESKSILDNFLLQEPGPNSEFINFSIFCRWKSKRNETTVSPSTTNRSPFARGRNRCRSAGRPSPLPLPTSVTEGDENRRARNSVVTKRRYIRVATAAAVRLLLFSGPAARDDGVTRVGRKRGGGADIVCGARGVRLTAVTRRRCCRRGHNRGGASPPAPPRRKTYVKKSLLRRRRSGCLLPVTRAPTGGDRLAHTGRARGRGRSVARPQGCYRP